MALEPSRAAASRRRAAPRPLLLDVGEQTYSDDTAVRIAQGARGLKPSIHASKRRTVPRSRGIARMMGDAMTRESLDHGVAGPTVQLFHVRPQYRGWLLTSSTSRRVKFDQAGIRSTIRRDSRRFRGGRSARFVSHPPLQLVTQSRQLVDTMSDAPCQTSRTRRQDRHSVYQRTRARNSSATRTHAPQADSSQSQRPAPIRRRRRPPRVSGSTTSASDEHKIYLVHSRNGEA